MGSPVLTIARGGRTYRRVVQVSRENAAWNGGTSCKGSAGFTLLETVIAMGLMAFVFLNLPGLLLVLDRMENEMTLRAGTLMCAREKMEELKFDAARGRLTTEEGSEVMPPGPYERMQRRWEVGSVTGSPCLRQVRTECSCRRKREMIRREILTLMYVAE